MFVACKVAARKHCDVANIWFLHRAKFGEQAFLDIYQKLYEAPDPAPMLSLGLVSCLLSTLYKGPQTTAISTASIIR